MNSRIANNLLTSLVILLANVCLSQQPVILDIGIWPSSPTSNSEVKLVLSLGTFNSTQYPGSSVQIENDSIFVKTCINESTGPSPAMHLDTLNLGTFPIGNYVLEYTGSMTYLPDTCDAFSSNDTLLYFTISEPLSVQNSVNENGLALWPNPNSTGMLYFNEDIGEYSISIKSSHGAELLSLSKEESLGRELDISNFSDGVYFLQIAHESKGILTTRVIVE